MIGGVIRNDRRNVGILFSGSSSESLRGRVLGDLPKNQVNNKIRNI